MGVDGGGFQRIFFPSQILDAHAAYFFDEGVGENIGQGDALNRIDDENAGEKIPYFGGHVRFVS